MLRKICVRLFALVSALMLIFSAAGTAFAAPVDSISVTIWEDAKSKKPLIGCEVKLYRVGEWTEQNTFRYTDAFKKCKASLDNLHAADLPEDLYSFVKEKSINPDAKGKTNNKGRFLAKDLDLGLYLVVQTTAPVTHYTFSPFLVSLPMQDEDGELTYNVEAFPKAGVKPPETPGKPGNPGKKPPLIQTGQLNWPVPVLAGSGMVLVALGWVLLHTGRERHGA